MLNIVGSKNSEVSLELHIKRKATGKTEVVHLKGTVAPQVSPEPESTQPKEVSNDDAQRSST